jgi:hypothetical protein
MLLTTLSFLQFISLKNNVKRKLGGVDVSSLALYFNPIYPSHHYLYHSEGFYSRVSNNVLTRKNRKID